MKTMCGSQSAGGRATATVSMAFGRAGSGSPISSHSRRDHAPAATTTPSASMRPAEVSTPSTRLSRRSIRVTVVHWRIRAPSSTARRRKPSTVSAGSAYPLSGS
jgi:hypothetical protein